MLRDAHLVSRRWFIMLWRWQARSGGLHIAGPNAVDLLYFQHSVWRKLPGQGNWGCSLRRDALRVVKWTETLPGLGSHQGLGVGVLLRRGLVMGLPNSHRPWQERCCEEYFLLRAKSFCLVYKDYNREVENHSICPAKYLIWLSFLPWNAAHGY